MPWEDKTLEANWTAVLGSWDAVNSEWDSQITTANWIQLTANGIWVEGYRPSNVRVTFTGPAQVYMGISDSNNHPVVEGVINSGDIKAIEWAGADLSLFILYNSPDSFSATKIEFFRYEPSPTLHFFHPKIFPGFMFQLIHKVRRR